MPGKTIEQVEVASQRVLMRLDFNVPMDASGAITDDRQFRLALPSIRSVIVRGGRLVLMIHLGRPKGELGEAKRQQGLRRGAPRDEQSGDSVVPDRRGDEPQAAGSGRWRALSRSAWCVAYSADAIVICRAERMATLAA